MKAQDNIPEAEHRALKNTIKDDYTEMIITLKDFHVAECIVWITGASLVFKTEMVTSLAVLAMVLGDVAVLHTWDPWILN